MRNNGSSKIKGPIAEVLFLDVKWLLNILKALLNATFYHLLSQPPVHLYLLYPIHCPRTQGGLVGSLLAYVLNCLLAYLLACIFAFRIISAFKTATFVCIITVKNMPFAQQRAGHLGFWYYIHSSLAFRVLCSCADIFFSIIESIVVSWSVLAMKLTSMFLAIFHPLVTTLTICGAQWKLKMWELLFKKQKKYCH